MTNECISFESLRRLRNAARNYLLHNVPGVIKDRTYVLMAILYLSIKIFKLVFQLCGDKGGTLLFYALALLKRLNLHVRNYKENLSAESAVFFSISFLLLLFRYVPLRDKAVDSVAVDFSRLPRRGGMSKGFQVPSRFTSGCSYVKN